MKQIEMISLRKVYIANEISKYNEMGYYFGKLIKEIEYECADKIDEIVKILTEKIEL